MDDTVILPPAATVKVTIVDEDDQSVDNERTESFDVYELFDVILEGQADFGETGIERHYPLRQVVATKFGIEVDKIALNQVLDLREHVVTMTNRLDAERKKKYSSTASSPASTPEFPILTEVGPSEKSEPGLITASTSIPGG